MMTTNAAASVVTRFPPSPTGRLHIGNIRTMLFNYLFTRKHGGEIVMRFEDTDRERSDQAHEADALEALAELGLSFDHGPFRQSERTDRYIAALEQLLASGHAYEAEESKGEEGARVIRFKNPNTTLSFSDTVRGEVRIDTTDFGDFVIARSRTNPIYHLSVVVDDMDMGVTHVIRGEDHITSTPRQMLLIQALGGSVPTYAHLPLIIGPDKKKLSKRHGAVTYQEFKRLGYIPAAIVNYLALLGWNPGTDQEFFTMDELIDTFSLERVNSAPAMFSYEKLASINRHHIMQLSDIAYQNYIRDFVGDSAAAEALVAHPRFAAIVDLVFKDRVYAFDDARAMIEGGELDWLAALPEYDAATLCWKDSAPERIREHLTHTRTVFADMPDDQWHHEQLKAALWEYATDAGRGEVLWPLRFALTAQEKSPDPFTVADILGRETTVARIDYALTQLAT